MAITPPDKSKDHVSFDQLKTPGNFEPGVKTKSKGTTGSPNQRDGVSRDGIVETWKKYRPKSPRDGTAQAFGKNTVTSKTTPKRWPTGLTANLLVEDIVAGSNLPRSQADRIVHTPMSDLTYEEVDNLTQTQVSTTALNRLRSELLRSAAAFGKTGDEKLETIVQSIANGLPRETDLYAAKAVWDLLQALPRANDRRLSETELRAPQIATDGSQEKIRDAIISWKHDQINTSGYRVYMSSQIPDPSGDYVAEHQFEAGMLFAGQDNQIKYYFNDTNDELDDETQYFLWVTAYNGSGESAPSNVVRCDFPAAIRGDLNRDGILDDADLAALMRVLLGEKAPLATADVNADGWVNQADLDALWAKIHPEG